MTKFETVGVNLQYDATNAKEANKSFAYSCNCCCHKGIKLDCDKCAINHVHSLIIAHFDDRNKNTEGK